MACLPAPGLLIEKQRLATLGGAFLGIVGDERHSFGYHLCDPPTGDYSTLGPENNPVGPYSCALDAGMNWAASRPWLQWLIKEIREDKITGISEVIGSFDGKNVRYWSDGSGWQQEGVKYQGEGHDTWTHVAIYRSTAKVDHKILAGWTATGYTPAEGDEDMEQTDKLTYPTNYGDRRVGQAISDVSNLRDWLVGSAPSPIGPGGKPVEATSPLGILLAAATRPAPSAADIAAEIIKQLGGRTS